MLFSLNLRPLCVGNGLKSTNAVIEAAALIERICDFTPSYDIFSTDNAS